MLGFRTSVIAAMAVLAIGLSASEGSAEQKLCVSPTGATRVVETPEKCRRVETTVKIPEAEKGETIKTSSYVVSGTGAGGVLQLSTADRGSTLFIWCNASGSYDAGWFASSPDVAAGDIVIINDVSGQAVQSFSDLAYNAGLQDNVTIPALPWTGTFTAKYGKSLSRFEVTVSNDNPQGNCLVTLFAIGFGSAYVHKF